MVEAWTWPAYVAVLLGTAAFAVLLVPIVALESRRYGTLTARRLLGAVAASVYGVALVAYTLLPLPDPSWCDDHPGHPVAWVPLHSLGEIRDATAGASATAVLSSVVVLQVVFNVVLFVPWGVLARRFFLIGPVAAIASGAAVSLLIETAQGTGLFGIYDCAYRFADVDDLIANSLGAAVGVLLARPLLWWMPGADLQRRRREPRAVTRRRRLLGAMVDVGVLAGTAFVVLVVERSIALYGAGVAVDELDDAAPPVLAVAVAGVVVLAPCLLGTRASLGQRATWLRPVRVDRSGTSSRRPPLWRALVRVATGLGAFTVLMAVDGSWSSAALTALVVVSAFAIVLDPAARGISHRLAGLRLQDARSPATQQPVARPRTERPS